MNLSKWWPALSGVLVSGICWYAAFDLSYHAWWALWLAPLPILYLSVRASSGVQAFVLAFAAYLIGRLSWWGYLHSVLPLPLVLVFTLFFPLAFGLIVLAVRRMVAVAPPAVAVFAYPVLWTAFEYLQFLFTRDGTIGSIAYTQCDFLPVVQVAAVAGVLGVSFVISYVPSVLALSVYYHSQGKKVRGLVFPAIIVVAGVFLYGGLRLSEPGWSSRDEVTVGMAAISRDAYGNVYDPAPRVEIPIANHYLQEVRVLAGQGVRLVLLPEKGIPVSDSAEAIITGLFTDEARRAGITIIAGVTRIYKDHPECQAWVISPEGKLLLNYRKVNLFEGEVFDGFKAGKEPGFFQQGGISNGVAICKDLDYDNFIRRYGRQGASILYVPAWDFNVDGWWHCRIAMMRAVENGYSLVRNAQEGRLTISDDRGRVTAEASCEGAKHAALTGRVGASASRTVYSRWGNWWGWVNLVAAICFLGMMIGRKKRTY